MTDSIDRRQVLKMSGPLLATGVGATADYFDSDDFDDGEERFSDSIYSTNSSMATITFLMAQEENIYEDHNIDMKVEITNFPKASRAVPSGLTPINFTDLPAVSKMLEEGYEVYLVDHWINLNNGIITLNDSDIEEVPDLEGKVLGVPFWGSGTTTSLGAMCRELYDFDIENDTAETVSSPPPALWNLLKKGEIDAMGQFLSYTLQAMGSDKHRIIFNPFDEWKNETGHPPSNGVVVAKKNWVDENPGYALRWLKAYQESITYHREHSDEALKRYGRLIGLSEDDGTLGAAQQLFDEGRVYASGWTEDYVSSQIDLMKLLVNYDDELKHVPDREKRVLLREEIEEMAN